MAPTKYADRSIPKISLHDFESRVDEITAQLVHAAETDGFFGLINHGISEEEIENVRIPFTPPQISKFSPSLQLVF
jgi:hypothetical protein